MELTILISIIVLSVILYFVRKSKLRIGLLILVVIYIGFTLGLILCIDSIIRLIHPPLPDFYTNILWYTFLIFTSILVLFFGAYYCGWLCPFGSFLEICSKVIPQKLKITIPQKIHNGLRWTKYVFMTGCFLFPVLLEFLPCGIIFPNAEKYCPVCVHVPRVAYWILVGIIIFSIFSVRFWCKYLCPFHAFLSILGRISLFKKSIDYARWTNCKKCVKVCPMSAISEENNKIHLSTWQCIQCNECSSVCKFNAIPFKLNF
jgi:polyferredoxin